MTTNNPGMHHGAVGLTNMFSKRQTATSKKAATPVNQDQKHPTTELFEILIAGIKDAATRTAAETQLEIVKEAHLISEEEKRELRGRVQDLEQALDQERSLHNKDLDKVKAALSCQGGKIGEVFTKLETNEKKFEGVDKHLTKETKEREAVEKKITDVNTQLGKFDERSKKNREKDVKELKIQKIRAERREREANIVVRGVPYAEDETPQSLHAAMVATLEGMALPERAKVRYCKRLVNKNKPRPAEATSPPPVVLALETFEHKKMIFAALPQWGSHDCNKRYKFAHDYPPSLKAEIDSLEKLAFELRRDTKCKTRVAVNDVNPILMVKATGETRFAPYKAEGPGAPQPSGAANSQ